MMDLEEWTFSELREAYLARLDEALAIANAHLAHEWFFGVPCGPTLAMIDPHTFAYWAVRS